VELVMASESTENVRPYGHRVAVVDVPADDKSPAGLIVPVGMVRLKRGIVTGCGVAPTVLKFLGDEGMQLEPGDLVWYLPDSGWTIGDTRIIDLECVVAVERKSDEESYPRP
jgi:hypothetical protein